MRLDAVIMAGGLGTRMCSDATEKPMLMVGNEHTVMRVVSALEKSKFIDRIIVSVSPNTKKTEQYLKDNGIETIRTSGMDFMNDMHDAFSLMNSEFVLTCPSDLPLIKTETVDSFIENFRPEMESSIAVIDTKAVTDVGVEPSFTIEIDGKLWVLSGLCISDRKKTLAGKYLSESYYRTDRLDIAVNVNTREELSIARSLVDKN